MSTRSRRSRGRPPKTPLSTNRTNFLRKPKAYQNQDNINTSGAPSPVSHLKSTRLEKPRGRAAAYKGRHFVSQLIAGDDDEASSITEFDNDRASDLTDLDNTDVLGASDDSLAGDSDDGSSPSADENASLSTVSSSVSRRRVTLKRPKTPDIPEGKEIPHLDLPASASDLLLPAEHVLQAVGIYEVLRHFRIVLRLSPFTFEDFCASLLSDEQSNLQSEIHITLIKALLREEDNTSTTFGPHDLKDSVNVCLFFLDSMTWPDIVRSYLDSEKHPEYRKHLSIVESPNYPFVPYSEKLQVLQTLTDLFLAVSKAREEIVSEGNIHYDDHCRACHKLGDLLCCETCSAVYHLTCVEPPMQEVPEDDWLCSVCRAHQVKGVTDCLSEAEKSGFLLRQEPIGFDRHARKYWLLCRRIIVESEKEPPVYYSTKLQLEELLESLDPLWENELISFINELKEDIVKQMGYTEELTNAVKGHRKSVLDTENAQLKKIQTERAERKAKEEEERKAKEEEEERKRKEKEERKKKEEEKDEKTEHSSEEEVEDSNTEKESNEECTEMEVSETVVTSEVEEKTSSVKEDHSGNTTTKETVETTITTTTVTTMRSTTTVSTVTSQSDSTNSVDDISEPPFKVPKLDKGSGDDKSSEDPLFEGTKSGNSSDVNGEKEKGDNKIVLNAKSALAEAIKASGDGKPKVINLQSLLPAARQSLLSVVDKAGDDGKTDGPTKTVLLVNREGGKVTLQVQRQPISKEGIGTTSITHNTSSTVSSTSVDSKKMLTRSKTGSLTPKVFTDSVTLTTSSLKTASKNTEETLVMNKDGEITKVNRGKISTTSNLFQLSNHFKLGAECSFKQYQNQYTTNNLALNKHQHNEERDKRRHLSHKFSLTSNSEFKWNGVVIGNRTNTLATLRLTITNLEGNIQAPFLHSNWANYRQQWQKAVQMCQTPRDFALALLILEACIKPCVFNHVWNESLGHIRLTRITIADREEWKKKEKEQRKRREDEDEGGLKPLVWIKYTMGLKHQVWKQKGEEYRVTGGNGWQWISAIRNGNHKPQDSVGLRLVAQKMKNRKVRTAKAAIKNPKLSDDGGESQRNEEMEVEEEDKGQADDEREQAEKESESEKQDDAGKAEVKEELKDDEEKEETTREEDAKMSQPGLEEISENDNGMKSPSEKKDVSQKEDGETEEFSEKKTVSKLPLEKGGSAEKEIGKQSPSEKDTEMEEDSVSASDSLEEKSSSRSGTSSPKNVSKEEEAKPMSVRDRRRQSAMDHYLTHMKEKYCEDKDNVLALELLKKHPDKVDVELINVSDALQKRTYYQKMTKPSSKLDCLLERRMKQDEIERKQRLTVETQIALKQKLTQAIETAQKRKDAMDKRLAEKEKEKNSVANGEVPPSPVHKAPYQCYSVACRQGEGHYLGKCYSAACRQSKKGSQQTEPIKSEENVSEATKSSSSACTALDAKESTPENEQKSENKASKENSEKEERKNAESSGAKNESEDSTCKDVEMKEEKSNQANEERTDQGNEEKTDQANEEKTNQANEEKTDQANEEKTDQANEEKTNQANEKNPDQANEEKSNQANEEKRNHVNKEKRDQASEEKTNQVSEEKTDKDKEEKTKQATEEKTDQANESMEDEDVDIENVSFKDPVKGEDKKPERATSGTPDKDTDATSSQPSTAKGSSVSDIVKNLVIKTMAEKAVASGKGNPLAAQTITNAVANVSMEELESRLPPKRETSDKFKLAKTTKLVVKKDTKPKNGNLPKCHKFETLTKKKSLFVLERNELRKIARQGAKRESSWFNYNSKMNNVCWPYPCPRPFFKTAWRYRTMCLQSLSAAALQLRVLWACVRWDDMSAKPPAGGTNTVSTETEITTTELLKRREVGIDGLRSEFLVRKIVVPLGVPEKPKEKYTPQRSGLRERKRLEPSRPTEPSVSEVWVPEEVLELWEIKQFGEKLERQRQVLQEKAEKAAAAAAVSVQTSTTTVTAQQSPAQIKAQMEQQLKQQRLALAQKRIQETQGAKTTNSSVTTNASSNTRIIINNSSQLGKPGTTFKTLSVSSASSLLSQGMVKGVQPKTIISGSLLGSGLRPGIRVQLPGSSGLLRPQGVTLAPKPGASTPTASTGAITRLISPATTSAIRISSPATPQQTKVQTIQIKPPTSGQPVQSLQFIQTPGGQLQVKGLLPGQIIQRMPDGKFQILTMATTASSSSTPNTPASASTAGLQNSPQVITTPRPTVSIRPQQTIMVSVGGSSNAPTLPQNRLVIPARLASSLTSSSATGAVRLAGSVVNTPTKQIIMTRPGGPAQVISAPTLATVLGSQASQILPNSSGTSLVSVAPTSSLNTAVVISAPGSLTNPATILASNTPGSVLGSNIVVSSSSQSVLSSPQTIISTLKPAQTMVTTLATATTPTVASGTSLLAGQVLSGTSLLQRAAAGTSLLSLNPSASSGGTLTLSAGQVPKLLTSPTAGATQILTQQVAGSSQPQIILRPSTPGLAPKIITAQQLRGLTGGSAIQIKPATSSSAATLVGSPIKSILSPPAAAVVASTITSTPQQQAGVKTLSAIRSLTPQLLSGLTVSSVGGQTVPAKVMSTGSSLLTTPEATVSATVTSPTASTSPSSGAPKYAITPQVVEQVVRQALLQNQAPEIQSKLLAMQRQIQQQQQPSSTSTSSILSLGSVATPPSVRRGAITLSSGAISAISRSVGGGIKSSSGSAAAISETPRSKSKGLTQDQKEEQTRANVCGQVMKSILDRIEREEKQEQRNKKRLESAEEKQKRLAILNQHKALFKHKETLKREIHRKRSLMERNLQQDVYTEMAEVLKKKTTPSYSLPKSPPAGAAAVAAPSAVVPVSLVATAKMKKQGHHLQAHTVETPKGAAAEGKTASSSARKRKQKIISTGSKGLNPKEKLYCVCKTPYDDSKFYIGCDLCSDWFHGACVNISESQAKSIDSYICDDCRKQQENTSEELYCLCRTPYDENQFYVGCDRCQDWFHGDCVGISKDEADTLDVYVCPNCQKQESADPIAQKTLTQSEYQELNKLLKDIQSHKMAWPFLKPVDPREVPDYYDVVLEPMDLTIVEAKLKAKAYKKLNNFMKDVTKIFDNCRLYNPVGTPFFQCAEVVETFFAQRVKNLRSAHKL